MVIVARGWGKQIKSFAFSFSSKNDYDFQIDLLAIR